MISGSRPGLQANILGEGRVARIGEKGWRLEIPAGQAGCYRLAQVDDYHGIPRSEFPWSQPVQISLRARTAARNLPGTWGFGLWNDPFGLGLIRGSGVRFPSLPNTAWFFFASAENYLSFREDLPANGQLAATFASPSRLPLKLILGSPLFSLVLIPLVGRWLRGWLGQYIRQDATQFDHDPREWHYYEIERRKEKVLFKIDGELILETGIAPRGALGLVIWIDNQYASWQPDGQVRYGTLASHEATWLEIDDLDVSPA
jgi:hypothetical protein